MRAQKYSQPCRINEVEVLQVEHDDCSTGDLAALDLALQKRRASKVEFTPQAQHRPVLLMSNIDKKLILNGHTMMLSHVYSGQAHGHQRDVVAKPARGAVQGGSLDALQQLRQREAWRRDATSIAALPLVGVQLDIAAQRHHEPSVLPARMCALPDARYPG